MSEALYIREDFESGNLEKALAASRDGLNLEFDMTKQERDIIRNLVVTYRNKVMKEAENFCKKNMPDIDEHFDIIGQMKLFIDHGFANDDKFQFAYEEIFCRLAQHAPLNAQSWVSESLRTTAREHIQKSVS